MNFLLRGILMLCLFLSSALPADELLKKSDVHKVMQQLFKQHVDKKEMTSAIMKNALKVYIDQFDPNRIYLLESEVHPYLNPTDSEMNQILEQYQNDDLTIYVQLNNLIQKSINRSRQYRKELEKNPTRLVQESKLKKSSDQNDARDTDQRRYFAKNEQVLKQRIESDIVDYIRDQNRRHGEAPLKHDETKTIASYEKSIEHDENQYLATDEAGHPLSPAEQENLFALHVLKSLAKTLDAHTKVLDNTEAYDMKVRLEKEYNGVGVILKKQGDQVLISGFVPGSSAEKNGTIKVNDRVISINGRDVTAESFDRVLEMFRDENIPEIALVVTRTVQEDHTPTNKEIKVKLKRETIAINEGRVDVASQPYKNGIIGEITLHMFYQGKNGVSSEEDVRNAIQKLQKEGNLIGLVLDLRDNSGGFLLQAVKVAGLFISSGIIVISKYSNGEEHFYRDIDGKSLYEGPLVVLTSRETASAAEIVAQALQDYGVAIIAGDEQTYGKGTIQSQTVTEGGSSSYFKVTVGKYYTVSGKTPQLQGVKADILVPSKYNREAVGEEFLEETVAPDKIASTFKDPMTDIDTDLKPWYMRYYASHLQQKQKTWRNMLPTLRKNSIERVTKNKTYQRLLKSSSSDDDEDDDSNTNAPWLFPDEPKDGHGEDVQMTEAINIVKDMINLHAETRK